MNRYYDFNRIRSYNRMYNMIVGARGCGKSYGAKRIAIKNFLKSNGREQFVYVRRYKSEIKEDKKFDNFFDDIREEFPEHELTIRGNKAYCDGKLMGYAIPLSTAVGIKSVPYPFVTMIIFDEFILDTGYNYLSNEPLKFLDLCSTIVRDRNNVRIFLLANNVTVANPYYEFWGICPKKNDRFVNINEECILEQITNDDFVKSLQENKFTKLIKNTDYYKFNILNESINDSEDYIATYKRGELSDKFVIYCTDTPIQISFTNDMKIFCHQKINKTCNIYNIDIANLKEGHIVMTNSEKTMMLTLVEFLREGNLLFENPLVKQKVIMFIKKLGLRI